MAFGQPRYGFSAKKAHWIMTHRLNVMFRAAVLATVLIPVLGTVSCEIDDADDARKSELGAQIKEFEVAAVRGTVEVPILSNEAWTAAFIDPDIDWASIEETSMHGDGTIRIGYAANDYFARMARLRICAGNRADTVRIKQRGALTPELSFASSSITVPGKGGKIRAPFSTNIDLEDIRFDIAYTSDDEGGWIGDHRYMNGYLFFECKANTSEFTRNARITVSYTDGWGVRISSTLYQIQANRNEELGTQIGFDEARDLAGIPVTRDVYIEGWVVSNKESFNAGACLQTTATAIDYTPSQKTVYIESLDGRYGFRLVCKTAADNIFEQYGKVRLLLKGTTILQDDDTSVKSYYITGVTSNMVMSAQKGSAASLPVKERYMDELTDDDVYTYVTLKACEFPIRKGPLTPVNEGYTSLFAVNRIAKYPTLIRDIRGKSMYLMTNINCPYRRDGSKLPYGSGKLRGVVVHEHYTRFEYEDTADQTTWGQIGRYQLRHQSKGDIFDEMAPDLAANFSALAFEMRYAHVENNRALATTDGMAGYITHTSLDPEATVYGTGDWSQLGPCGSDHKQESDSGDPLGITLLAVDGGANYTAKYQTGSNAGKGYVTSIVGSNPLQSLAPALATTYTWNYDDTTDGAEGSADGFLVCFSTKGISSNMLSLQLSVVNQADRTPRRWKVEWSAGGRKTDVWSLVGRYTPAMTETWASCKVWNLSGMKYVDMPLPLEMLDRETVYLRLVPAENSVSSYEHYYDPGTQITNTGNSTLSYLGIRYNK